MAGRAAPGDAGPTRWRLAAWAVATAIILLVPLSAMQVTDEVAWTVFDFAIVGALLMGAGVTYELAARMTGNGAYRAGVAVALFAALMLIWVTGAVGIIGTEDNDANLMYGGVLAVGIIGAIIGRFRPDGMARALFATAATQVLVAVIALITRSGSEDPTWPLDILALTVLLASVWCTSAWLFRRAVTRPSPTREAP